MGEVLSEAQGMAVPPLRHEQGSASVITRVSPDASAQVLGQREHTPVRYAVVVTQLAPRALRQASGGGGWQRNGIGIQWADDETPGRSE